MDGFQLAQGVTEKLTSLSRSISVIYYPLSAKMCMNMVIQFMFVICLSLSAAVAVSAAFFGQGTGPIFLDELQCIGTENGLLACPNTMMHDCTHSEDAGVRCQGNRKCKIRLLGMQDNSTPSLRGLQAAGELC